MSKLVRLIAAMGQYYTVEYARRADGSEPAKEFLDLLKEGMWADDPEADDLPHDEQIEDWHRFLELIRQMATEGEPMRAWDLNYLEEGLWEFKVYNKRLVFYDTPGDGNYTPKAKVRDRRESPEPDSEMWWVPTFDAHLRLANYWPKVGDRANPLDIEEGRRVREEDLNHDR